MNFKQFKKKLLKDREFRDYNDRCEIIGNIYESKNIIDNIDIKE